MSMKLLILKLCLTISLAYVLITSEVRAQSNPLEVRVTNIKEKKGFMMLAVYNEKEVFLSTDALTSRKVAVPPAGDVVFYLEPLPYGEYAISVYHDVNSNGDLDTNFIGIPKEPYGFSNNDLGLMGIPKYDKSVFAYTEDIKFIEIELN